MFTIWTVTGSKTGKSKSFSRIPWTPIFLRHGLSNRGIALLDRDEVTALPSALPWAFPLFPQGVCLGIPFDPFLSWSLILRGQTEPNRSKRGQLWPNHPMCIQLQVHRVRYWSGMSKRLSGHIIQPVKKTVQCSKSDQLILVPFSSETANLMYQ